MNDLLSAWNTEAQSYYPEWMGGWVAQHSLAGVGAGAELGITAT